MMMLRGGCHPSLGPHALLLMLAAYADALALSRPALSLPQRREANILSQRALISQQRAHVGMQEPTVSSGIITVPGTPGDSMRKYYDEVMPPEHKKSALFSSWETYAAWLPARKYEPAKGPVHWLKLHNLKHWASEADVAIMLDQITGDSEWSNLNRNVVRYLSAPSGSGKTKSVLPAFNAGRRTEERLDGFTHYIPIAFANNNNKDFCFFDDSNLDKDRAIARAQGAFFIYQCLKTILDEPHTQSTSISPNSWFSSKLADHNADYVSASIVSEMEALLRDRLGHDSYALIHLDEHCKMCGRDRHAANDAAFSAGAMEALAAVSGVAVVATYTAPPEGIPPKGYSGTCRGPVALPPVDPTKLMKDIAELEFPDPPGPEAAFFLRRLWGILQFRLTFCLQERVNGLHARGTDEDLEGFLKAYQKAATTKNLTKAAKWPEEELSDRLKACIDCCISTRMERIASGLESVSRLLLGVKDGNGGPGTLGYHFPHQPADLVVLPDGRISGSLRTLLAQSERGVPVYECGARRMKRVLSEKGDILSRTPLEEAYLWTLVCRAAMDKVLDFGGFLSPIFSVKGIDLQSGRIFPGQDVRNFTFDTLESDVIYYADCPDRVDTTCKDSQLRADIFFRTSKDELVLIDVTGANDASGGKDSCNVVADKEQKLFETIRDMQEIIDASEVHPSVKVHGVVLAPFDMGRSSEKETDFGNWAMVVRGRTAQSFLGGLTQVLCWFEQNDSGAST